MAFKRKVAFVVWGLAGLALLAAGGFSILEERFNRAAADVLGRGEYELVTTDGGRFTNETLEGEPSAVFFGFAHCPEVCPTTLGDIGIWQDMLAEEGQKPLRAYFITVDPERDTPEMLGDYVSWVPGVTGVSGSRE
ncbi:MAG: SCO family protein, partial [Silicimonas sp.]